MTHVPYPGSAQSLTDLLAGRISVMFSPAPTVLPHIQSGGLTAIAATRTRRAAQSAEHGGCRLPGF